MPNPFDQFDELLPTDAANPFDEFVEPREPEMTAPPPPAPLLTPEQEQAAPEFTADYVIGKDEGFLENIGGRMLTAFGAMTAVDDDEVVDMLKQYPHIQTQKTDRGTFGVNTETGQQFVLNRPGFSGKDVTNALTTLLTYTPAGRAAAITGGIGKKIATTAAASAVTEYGVQKAQEAAGGDLDEWDIAISGAAGALPDAVVTPAIRAIKAKIPQNIKDAFDVGRVTTTDLLKEALTPAQQIMAKMVERMPITGTGSIKVGQKAERARVLDGVAAEYGIDPTTDFGETILNSFNRQRNASIKTASEARKKAVTKLNPMGVVPTPSALSRVDDAIAEIADLGVEGNTALLSRLDGIKSELQEGGRNFGRLIKFRTNTYKGASFDDPYPKETNKVLKKIGDGLSGDMERFADTINPAAGRNWNKSNKIFRDDIQSIKDTQLKKLIQTGRLGADTTNQVLDSGRPELLRMFYGKLDAEGKKATRQRILQTALTDAGWPNNINPKKFLAVLESKKGKRAMDIFFPGVKAKQLDGVKEYLRLTEAAGNIGKGVGMAASGGVGTIIGSGLNLVSGGLIGILGHTIESKTARNLLGRLHYAKDNPQAAERIMRQLRPLILAAGQELSREDSGQQPEQAAPNVE